MKRAQSAAQRAAVIVANSFITIPSVQQEHDKLVAALLREDRERRQMERFIERMAAVAQANPTVGEFFIEAREIARKLAKDRSG